MASATGLQKYLNSTTSWILQFVNRNYISKRVHMSQIKTKNLSTNCESVMKKVVKKEARAKRINSKEFFGKKNIFMTHCQNAL